jgi:RNA polymerase sigma factor (sigma-70 family)
VTDATTRAAIETVIRLESARLIAGLARYTGDIGLAEDLAQDAVVAALEQWPEEGVPRNAGAWLMTVAKRRAIDTFRRNRELAKRYAQIGRAIEAGGDNVTPDFDRAFSDDIDDDLLRLIFTACHPVLGVQARVALTLRMLGGLTTTEIARAYLVSEPTIAQRIVRAKKTLAAAHVPFEVPASDQRPARLASVLEVIYLIHRGQAALEKAIELGGERGAYALQAAIAVCHARAFRPEDTDWAAIVGLYGVLAEVMPSPVVELNRAVAVSMAYGPQAGLDLVDQLAGEPALANYHLLPSVRGDLLSRLGREDEARAEFKRAAVLTRNERERRLSAERARPAGAGDDAG